MVALLVGHQTCDLQVAGSSPGWALLRSGLGKLLIPKCLLSPSSIICTLAKGVISLAGKVTVGLVESNSSLQSGL